MTDGLPEPARPPVPTTDERERALRAALQAEIDAGQPDAASDYLWVGSPWRNSPALPPDQPKPRVAPVPEPPAKRRIRFEMDDE